MRATASLSASTCPTTRWLRASGGFRRRHSGRLEDVFLQVLEMCRDAGLIRLGLVVLDGTKVKANASLEANRSAATIDQQVARMVAEAEGTDRREDRLFGPEGRETLPKALRSEERRVGKECRS